MSETKPVHHYRAFSLGVQSQLRLPELRASTALPDIAIRLGAVAAPATGSMPDRCISASSHEVHLFWERAGSFLIRQGREIVIQPADNADEALIRTGVLGPALATILQQRGLLVLHASAVIVDGKAIAFAGWKGQGKSTMAAALFARGCSLLTDDLLALNGEIDQPVLAHPGFPQFKLWPDSAELSLGENPDELPKLITGYEKRVRVVSDGFAVAPVPLGAIYILANGPELRVDRLPSQETFKQIVSNTYCARYGKRALGGPVGGVHLRRAARVAASVAVYRLERPSSFIQLGPVTDFVLQHARSS